MTTWLRAGVRNESATSAADERRRANLRQARLRADADLQEARRGWERGLVRPWVITMTLDANRLDGPGVDEACGVEEPTVDLWEAGEVYPTFEQLCKLSTLVGVTPAFFVKPHEFIDVDRSSLRFHGLDPHRSAPIERFNTDAIVRATGVDILDPHQSGGRA